MIALMCAAVLAADFRDVDMEWMRNALIFVVACLGAWLLVLQIRAHLRKQAPEKVIVAEPGKPLPQPLVIREEVKYVELPAFRELKFDVDKIREVLPAMETRLREDAAEMEHRLGTAAEARLVKLHERINPLAEKIEACTTAAANWDNRVNEIARVNNDRVNELVRLLEVILRRRLSKGN